MHFIGGIFFFVFLVLPVSAFAMTCDEAVKYLGKTEINQAYFDGLQKEISGELTDAQFVYTVLSESCASTEIGAKAQKRLDKMGSPIEPVRQPKTRLQPEPVPSSPPPAVVSTPQINNRTFRNYQRKGHIRYGGGRWVADTSALRIQLKRRNNVGAWGIGLEFLGAIFLIVGVVEEDPGIKPIWFNLGGATMVAGVPLMIGGYAGKAATKKHIRRVEHLVEDANAGRLSIRENMREKFASVRPYLDKKSVGVRLSF